MSNCFVFIIMITLICGFISSFFSFGAKLSKYVGFIISLITVLMLLSPVFSFFSYIKNMGDIFDLKYEEIIDENNNSLENLMLNKTDEELKKAIAVIINSKFDVNLNESSLSILYDSENMSEIIIKKIIIDTSGSFYVKDLYEIKDYIENTFMSECEVR